MRLVEETTTTFADADVEVALVPVGSTEQHGPALPLGTDHLVAEAFAAELDHEDAVVLPTLPVGVSDHHRQFHGTLSLSDGTFERCVRETLASMADHGVRKAVVVNGHGGNTPALRRAARRLRTDEVAFAAPWNWWDGCGDLPEELFGEHAGHADAVETSMVRYVRGELVREDALETAEADGADAWGTEIHGAELGFDTADFTASGAVGTPTRGSREAGERLFEAALAELGALVDWLAERPFEDLLPAEHR
jgi:creatinine amidohydrolase